MSRLEIASAAAGEIDAVLSKYGLQILSTEESAALVTFVIGRGRRRRRAAGGAR